MMKFAISFLLLLYSVLGYTQTHSFQSHDGINIIYDDEGEGEVVVLLHGFINTRKSWGRAVLKKDLISKGYRVIVPDLRGNGDSDKPHEEEYWNNDNEVKDIIALMDALTVSSFVVVGYSRGTTVAAELATQDDRVTKLILGGMGAEFTDPKWEIPSIFSDAFAGNIPPSDMTSGAINYAKSIDADLTCLSLQQKYQPFPSKEELSKIKIPTLVIVGNKDNQNNKAKSLYSLFKNAQMKIVKGEHNHTYKQKNFSRVVLRFIGKPAR